ncbi:MAG TPA: hypothetical protein VF681_14535 [Abditibacteriaceae bacterium]|jgi:hypothetical protein
MSWIEKLEAAFIADLRTVLDRARMTGDLVSADALMYLMNALESGAPLTGRMAASFRLRFEAWLDACPTRREIWNDNEYTLDLLLARRR